MPVTRNDFAIAVLDKMGYSTYLGNVVALVAWAQAEGGHAQYNPLNTTQVATNSWVYNNAGVANYPSFLEGVNATVQTLKQTRYAAIQNALAAAHATKDVLTAVVNSDWGTTGDPVALEATVRDNWGLLSTVVVGP